VTTYTRFHPLEAHALMFVPFFSFWSLVFMISVFGSLYPHALRNAFRE
jgi:hypothetical protein